MKVNSLRLKGLIISLMGDRKGHESEESSIGDPCLPTL
ncbi:hypothetical protein CWATWH0402_1042 [Crocosphaera watsonii WH 0402]|uniref:Uncharacterized protein n=1 Tax=Crocosphaera watsonii WH 0402 TaxID=1284629 RepID=T2JWB1_CROWT|nr:hypothetical protein CWATWH0402_1042 [Crocosphaera watsonii WH 0402]